MTRNAASVWPLKKFVKGVLYLNFGWTLTPLKLRCTVERLSLLDLSALARRIQYYLVILISTSFESKDSEIAPNIIQPFAGHSRFKKILKISSLSFHLYVYSEPVSWMMSWRWINSILSVPHTRNFVVTALNLINWSLEGLDEASHMEGIFYIVTHIIFSLWN